MKSRPVTVTTWATWLGLFTATTLLLTRLSDAPEVRVAHGVLVYLVLIIGASRQGGRVLSLVMVTLGYLAVDWFYVPPRRTLFSAQGLDWFVLGGFVVTGMLISELFASLQRAAQIARDRAAEIERLSAERLQFERDAATVRVLREADRLKNALIDSIAHDLRSPVATLALVSDPAAGISPEPALQRVQEETHRLGEFLSTLQRFASESGGTPLRTEPHDAHDIIRTAVRTAEARLRDRVVRTPETMPGPLVECDHTLTVHALGNLLQNAARYSPDNAPVDVLVESGTTDVHIVVADRGPGISPDEVSRLFSALRRIRKPAHGTQTTDDDDLDARLGMGLAIARTFAHAQRGALSYRPRSGGGSEFVLRLPRAPITLHNR